jgi:hypothetical protein
VVSLRDEAATARAREWREAAAVDRDEAARVGHPPTHWIAAGFLLGVAACAAGVAPGIFPLSPGYATSNTTAQVVAAVVASVIAIAVIPLAARVAARLAAAERGLGSLLLYGAALLSAGAAAIHFAVAKGHFDEYTLYGVFFVASGVAQLVWPLLVLFRPARALLLLGVLGNLLIVALWAVDRTWGLPIGPEHWKPETVGFADITASVFEILLALGALALLAPSLRAQAYPRPSRGAALLLIVAVGTPTVLGLLSAMGVASSFLTPSA